MDARCKLVSPTMFVKAKPTGILDMGSVSISHNQQFGVFMNVGFNKGYNFANWMNIFTPYNNVTAVSWFAAAFKNKLLTASEDDCGWCEDCKVAYSLPSNVTYSKQKDFIFFGVDINSRNHEMVNKTISLLEGGQGTGTLSCSFYLSLSGVSSEPGFVDVPICKFGDELCRLPENKNTSSNANYETVRLPMVTVEGALHTLILEHKDKHAHLREAAAHFFHNSSSSSSTDSEEVTLIDMLLIDVEGFDALVVQGAKHLLKRRAIRVIRFEYNMITPWRDMRLEGKGWCWRRAPSLA